MINLPDLVDPNDLNELKWRFREPFDGQIVSLDEGQRLYKYSTADGWFRVDVTFVCHPNAKALFQAREKEP